MLQAVKRFQLSRSARERVLVVNMVVNSLKPFGEASQQEGRDNLQVKRLSVLMVFICTMLSILIGVHRPAFALSGEVTAKAASKSKGGDALESLKSCKGKTADSALKSAQKAGIDAEFVDSFDVDVTESVTDASNGSDVHKATVTEVKTHDLWLLGKSVTFVLDYTDPDAKSDRDEKADEENNRKKAVEKLGSCIGDTAWKAYELSKAAGYEIAFEDSFGIDVTKDVIEGGESSDAGKATVTDIEMSDPWLFVSGSARAKIDYVEPKAARKREKEERRKQEEQALKENKTSIEKTKGGPVGKAQQLVEKIGCSYEIKDEYDADVTEEVCKAKKGSGIRKATVTSVAFNNDVASPLVTIGIDYVGLSSVKRLAKEEGYPAEVTFSDISAKVEDESPASDSPTFFVTVSGTITSNDTWSVQERDLPSLGTSEDSLYSCAGIELEGDKTSLGAGESSRFVYHYRLNSSSTSVVLKTENDGVIMHGGDELINAVDAQFKSAKEEKQRAWEEARASVTCYYTENGKCYHSSKGCPSLSRSKNIHETTVGQAKSWGLDACDRCH